jgi:hypothetical protein
MYVERYNDAGESIGFSAFEVNPVNSDAYSTHGAVPLDPLMAGLGGSSVGGSLGGITGSSIGASAGIIANEAVGNWVGVNEYQFDSREALDDFISGKGFSEIKLNTNVQQDKSILDAAIFEGDSFGRYNLITNNCSQYASKALSAGGINTTLFPIPNVAHDYIRKNNPELVE